MMTNQAMYIAALSSNSGGRKDACAVIGIAAAAIAAMRVAEDRGRGVFIFIGRKSIATVDPASGARCAGASGTSLCWSSIGDRLRPI
jgi:hypothetical protein